MSGLDIEGVLAGHAPRTQPPMGLVVGCSCGWRIGRTMYEGYDTHVAAVLREQIAAWLDDEAETWIEENTRWRTEGDLTWIELESLLAALVAPSRVPGEET